MTQAPAGTARTAEAPGGAPQRLLLSVEDVALTPPDSERRLLSDVQLSLAPGACIALVGPSGSGKTTLLRAIAGQVPVRAGRIRIDGHDLASLKGAARRRMRGEIGFVAQQHDLVEPLKVHANVMAGALGRWSNLRALRYLAWPRPDELAEAKQALAAVGLADKLREATSALSGGEQQRVAIARALVQRPKLLLADEPVASLDPATAHEVLTLLTGLARERGMGLVCSLHQPELASRHFHRTLELTGERLVEHAAASRA